MVERKRRYRIIDGVLNADESVELNVQSISFAKNAAGYHVMLPNRDHAPVMLEEDAPMLRRNTIRGENGSSPASSVRFQLAMNKPCVGFVRKNEALPPDRRLRKAFPGCW